MKVIAYSIKACEKELLARANDKCHDITFISNRLTIDTVPFAAGKEAVLVFSADDASAPVLRALHEQGIRYVMTRSTGTDHIDIEEAGRLGMKVANIPAYSPESIAEHALALMLALCRNLLPANRQMMHYDFSLDNLAGSTIHKKTVGIVGFGRTGRAMARILRGFGATVLVDDVEDVQSACREIGAEQVSRAELFRTSDIITFHVPLTDETRHLVNKRSIMQMKPGVMLINVSRGAVFNSREVYDALQDGRIGRIGMDVYEFEHNVFFFDHSRTRVDDKLLKAFIQHSRVLITPHQAFLTREALETIAQRTIRNIDLWSSGKCTGKSCRCAADCVTAMEPA